MKPKKLLSVLIVVALALVAIPLVALSVSADETASAQSNEKTLSVNKTTFEEGEPIYITATAPSGSGDWVGIATSDGITAIMWYYAAPYGSYFTPGSGVEFDIKEMATKGNYYLGGKYIGTELVNIPAGDYVIYFVEDNKNLDKGYLYSIPITVVSSVDGEEGGDEVDPDTPVDPDPEVPTEITLKMEKTTFTVGEPIMVSATYTSDTDWIAIFNDSTGSYVTSWYYIRNKGQNVWHDARNGSNLAAGEYSVRIIPNDGSRFTTSVAKIQITVVEDDAGASNPLDATYTPSTNGFAGGTVTVSMPSGETENRSIVMFWANENGKLEGYTPLARFKVTGEITSFAFDENVIIPEGATQLWVYAQNTTLGILSSDFIKIDLPDNSDMESLGTPNLSMVVISDIHIKSSLTDTSAVNFQNMLRDVINQHPNGVAIYIVGDMADGGQAGQYENMMALYSAVLEEKGVEARSYPMFFAIGNHDYPASNGAFLEYATLPDGSHPSDTSYDFWLNGYHYVFLGSDTPSGLGAYLNVDTLAWIDSKLAENRDPSRPTFVFLHQSLYNTVAGSLPGEGWHGVSNDSELRAVLAKYPEVMLFNGHSHWTMDSLSNMYGGNAELPIHAFNCASVSYLWSGYNKATGEHLDGSQGYIVEIYGNKIFVRGRDFSTGKWVASAQYLVALPECEHDYEITEIEYPNGYLSSGVATKACANCGAFFTYDAPALITFKGYSVAEYGVSSVVVSYSVNHELIAVYEGVNLTRIDIGVVACASGNLVNGDNKPINADGTTAEVTSGVVANSGVDSSFSLVSVVMKTPSWEKYADLEMVMCLYVIENGSVSYASGDTLTEAALPITYNGILSKEKEDK